VSPFRVDLERARELARILVEVRYVPDSLGGISPFADDAYRDVHFLFFMTAIDHNTHEGPLRYEAVVDGLLRHGSDLLYARAIAAAGKNRDLFTPSGLRQVSAGQLSEIFATPEGKLPAGLEERARLLDDAANRLLARYRGDAREIFASADGYIRRADGRGIAAQLAPFRAYEDPIGKKTFLLIKLLRRRGRLVIRDPENIRIPVDHVVFTLALRSGLVGADDAMLGKIRAEICLEEAEVRDLREATLEAYRHVATFAGLTADEFDDLLWGYGRECLREKTPFPEDRIAAIAVPLEHQIGEPRALGPFIRFIMGLGPSAPAGASALPVPVIPTTWYL
jgi:hypothetical protein